ncbi:MAG: hypothetical protein AMXMBFR7_48440 [Planctomycetota bacterium]
MHAVEALDTAAASALDKRCVEIPYVVHGQNPLPDPRPVRVVATREELNRLERDGYLVRKGFLDAAGLARMRRGLDELMENERREGHFSIHTGGGFGGLFMRQLMDRHASFGEILEWEALHSIARAMLGPAVSIRDTITRITWPGQPNQETVWHAHQQLIPEPLPPWFPFPHIVDALVYLDDLDEATGPLCVIPGSHTRLTEAPPRNSTADLPGQVKLLVPAGSVVFVHGNLWHRAMPTRPDGRMRRLIIVGYAPPWKKGPPWRAQTPDGLVAKLGRAGDAARRELLGLEGWH